MVKKTTDTEMQKQEQPVQQAEISHDVPVFIPDADIFEDDASVVVMLDMPGVPEKGIDIQIENDLLTVTGQQNEQRPSGFNLIYQAYDTGIFRRSFRILADIDRSKVAAKLRNGVLSVTLPKSAKAQPKKIKVATE